MKIYRRSLKSCEEVDVSENYLGSLNSHILNSLWAFYFILTFVSLHFLFYAGNI